MKIGIAIFCYERLFKLKQLIESLSECIEVDNFEIWVFQDGASSTKSDEHCKVTNYLNGTFPYFKNLNIIIRKENLGLKQNITEGITEVFEICDAIIVLEDDLILHKDFLLYMRSSLHLYSDNSSISCINAWLPSECKKNNAFLTNNFNCWGWATWKHSWNYKNYCKDIINNLDFYELREYCQGFSGNLWSQIYLNYIGYKNTWAINVQLMIWKEKKLCLNPPFSLVSNDGEDGMGSNSWQSKGPQKLVDQRININNICDVDKHNLDVMPYEYNKFKALIFRLAFNYQTLFFVSRLIYSKTTIQISRALNSFFVKR